MFQVLEARQVKMYKNRFNRDGITDNVYRQLFRFSKENVRWLGECFVDDIQESRGGALTQTQKMEITLRYLADPGFQTSVAQVAGVTQSTVSASHSDNLIFLFPVCFKSLFFLILFFLFAILFAICLLVTTAPMFIFKTFSNSSRALLFSYLTLGTWDLSNNMGYLLIIHMYRMFNDCSFWHSSLKEELESSKDIFNI